MTPRTIPRPANSWLLAVALLLFAGSPAHAQADEPGDLPVGLAGGWESTDTGPEDATLLHFQGDRCVSSWRGMQSVFIVSYGDGSITRTPIAEGVMLEEKVALDGDVLTLTYPEGNTRTYRRLDHTPHKTRVDPFEVGSRTPSAEEIAELAEDLLGRRKRDQDVRVRLTGLMGAARADGRLDSMEGYQAFMESEEHRALAREMGVIDMDNTRHLIGMVLDVGWIDAARFGRPANEAAFLIVQHSGHLGLMQTALPRIESEARERPELGQDFALLYDRTQLALGDKQRYGTQLTSDAEGTLRVHSLEDFASVDELRAQVGLPPLEEYLELFRSGGATVVVGDAP